MNVAPIGEKCYFVMKKLGVKHKKKALRCFAVPF